MSISLVYILFMHSMGLFLMLCVINPFNSLYAIHCYLILAHSLIPLMLLSLCMSSVYTYMYFFCLPLAMYVHVHVHVRVVSQSPSPFERIHNARSTIC